MYWNYLICFVTKLMALTFVGVTLANPLSDNINARNASTRCDETAHAWQKDALLVSLSTFRADATGQAPRWLCLYYSASTNKGYSIDASKFASSNAMEVNPHLKSAIGADFVDSDKAMQIALGSGLKSQKETVMSLIVMGQATPNPIPIWTVGLALEKGDVSVMIDARSGSVLRKDVGK